MAGLFGGGRKPKMVTSTQTTTPAPVTPQEEQSIKERTETGLAARGLSSSGIAPRLVEGAISERRAGRVPVTQTVNAPAPPKAPGLIGSLFGQK